MKDLITNKHKHMLWKDELGDTFLLTRDMEIYNYGQGLLGLYVWGDKAKAVVRSKWAVFEDKHFDEPWTHFRVKVSDLPHILALGTGFKKRPDLDGKWIRSRREILAHEIIPYRPELQEAISNG